MTFVPFPSFGGLASFTAAVKQQREAQGRLLPVVDLPDVDTPQAVHTLGSYDDSHASGLHNTTEGWVQQSQHIIAGLGYEQQPIAAVAAAAPRSKAQRAATKVAWASLCQQIEPSSKPPGPATPARPPVLASISARQVHSFCTIQDTTSLLTELKSSSSSSSSSSSLITQAVLVLDEPVMLAADTAWSEEAYMKGPTMLFCQQAELEQLVAPMPQHQHADEWGAARVKVCRISADKPQAASTPATTAHSGSSYAAQPPAVTASMAPSLRQLVKTLVLHWQPCLLHTQPSAPVSKPCKDPLAGAPASAQAPGPTAAAPAADVAQAANTTADGDAAAATAAAGVFAAEADVPSSTAAATDGRSSLLHEACREPVAVAAPSTPVVDRKQHMPCSTVVDESALSFDWLLPDRTAVSSDAAARPLEPAFADRMRVFVAARADEESDSLAAAAPGSSVAWDQPAEAPSSAAVGIACLEAPSDSTTATAARLAPNTHCPIQHRQQQHLEPARQLLRLPVSAVPSLVPLPSHCMPTRHTSNRSSDAGSSAEQHLQAAGQAGAPAASKPPSAAALLRTWLTALHKPTSRGRRQQGAGCSADAHARRRVSSAVVPEAAAAAGHAREAPLVGVHVEQEAAAAPDHTAAAPTALDPALEAAVPACKAADAHTDARASSPGQLQAVQQAMLGATDAGACSTQASDEAGSLQLSPGSMLIEVPVCVAAQQSESLGQQLLQEALSAAQTVLGLPAEAWDFATGPAAVAASTGGDAGVATVQDPASSSSSSTVAWDASWGELKTPPAGSSWCTPALLSMLSGAALQAGGAAAATAAANQDAATAPAGAALPSKQRQQQAQQQGEQLGARLLQQMIAADMQLGDEGDQMLPVLLFPDTDSCWAPAAIDFASQAGGAAAGACSELLLHCPGYGQQPTAHLELYFDWSLLQQQRQLPGSKRNSTFRHHPAASTKRLKLASGTALVMQHGNATGLSGQQDAWDPVAWLQQVHAQPRLQQLQLDLSRKPCGAAGDAQGRSNRQLAWEHSKHVLQAYLLHDGLGSSSAAGHMGKSGAAAAVAADAHAEPVPLEVAAAAEAWWQAHRKAVGATAALDASDVQGCDGDTGNRVAATAGAASAAAAGAPSRDLDFFMQLQGAGVQRSKRRHSAAANQPKALLLDSTGQLQEQQPALAAAAAETCPLSPAAPAKRPRLSAKLLQRGSPAAATAQDAQDIVQQQEAAALATADLAVNGALRESSAAHLAAAAAAEAAAASGPTTITVTLPRSILRLLLQLDGMRRSVLAAMPCPGPQLVEALLWQDAAAQQLLLQHKAHQQRQQQETGKGPSTQQRQHNKQLVVLVLLSQTAACLLYYGIKVAHMFMQHGLQRLPSVSDACQPALMALSAASDGLEQGGGGGEGVSAGGEHPKLALLRQLVMQRKAAKPGLKLLLVSETKAFFSLYHTLSAGILAVQLDRDRTLPAQGPPAGQHGASDADPAAMAAWETAVSSALAAAGCVLATHEQLHHPCMPLQHFDALIEYLPWQAAAGAPEGGAAHSSNADALKARFGPNNHIILVVQEPDLMQAAAELEAATAHAAVQQAVPGVATFSAAAAAAAAAVEASASKTPTSGLRPQLGASVAHPAAPMAPAGGASAQHHPARAATASEAPTAAGQRPEATAADAAAGPEVPLVLNVGPGSTIKQRQPLYQSLMQLEAQGYVLVERALGSSGSGGCGSSAHAVMAAVVDVVLTPKSCLCIWDDTKLPQEPGTALQAVSRALLALSMAFDTVFFLLEASDALLQAVNAHSTNLHALAKAAGVRLQLLVCFTAANTQDAVMHVCKEAASSFWALAANRGSGSSSGSNFSLQPPQGLTDIPTPAELQLSVCPALNPLSAAVLAAYGADLRGLFEQVMSEEGRQHPLLQVGLPPRSLQLLQEQASAVAARIQQQRREEEQQLLQPSQEGQPQQPVWQGQHHATGHAQHQQFATSGAEFGPGNGYDQGAWGADEVDLAQRQQQYQHHRPGHHQQQQHLPHQPSHDLQGTPQWREPLLQHAPAGYMQHDMQQQLQQPDDVRQQRAGKNSTVPQSVARSHMPAGYPRHHHKQPQQQQHDVFEEVAVDLEEQGQQDWGAAHAAHVPELGVDPAAVLDDFLSSRAMPAAAVAATGSRHRGAARQPTGHMAARSYRDNQQAAAMGYSAHAGAARRPASARAGPEQLQQGAVAASRGAADHRGCQNSYKHGPVGFTDDAAGMDAFEPQFVEQGDNLQLDHTEGPDAYWEEPQQQLFGYEAPVGQQLQQQQQARGYQGSVIRSRGREVPAGHSWGGDELLFEVDEVFADTATPRTHAQQAPWQRAPAAAFAAQDDDLGFDPDFHSGLDAVQPAPMQGTVSRGGMFAAAATRDAPQHRGSRGGRGMGHMAAGRDVGGSGFAVSGPTSSNSSGLRALAFMPHHKPSKQLKYQLPAAQAGAVKRKRGPQAGFQTKLFWG